MIYKIQLPDLISALNFYLKKFICLAAKLETNIWMICGSMTLTCRSGLF